MKTCYSKDLKLFKYCKVIFNLKSWGFGFCFLYEDAYRKSLMFYADLLCFGIVIEFGKRGVN